MDDVKGSCRVDDGSSRLHDERGSPETPTAVILCDTFTLVPGSGSLLSLILTRTELLIQNLAPDSQGHKHPPLRLKDCIGCRSFRGKNHMDLGGYFKVVFYPLRGELLGSVVYRQRLSWTFRTEASRDRERNLEIARTWAQTIWELAEEKELPSIPLSSPRRFLVLLNPFAGTGKALSHFHTHVMPVLMEANVCFTLLVTDRPNQAFEVVRDEDLSSWDVIVVMSGDGLMFEVVNGIMERPDWRRAIKKPLAILPGGSGNALAASVSHYSGHQQVTGTKLLNNCTYILCKGRPVPLDLISLTTSSGRRIFSFLSLAWGLISDVDIESEKYRFMGSARFSIGTFVRLTALRTYRGRLSYLPARPSLGETESFKDFDSNPDLPNSNNCSQNPSMDIEGSQALEDSLLVPLDQPVPSHWSVVPEDQFVLILALHQSHLGADLYTAPMVRSPGEGSIELCYATSRISRASLLKLFLSMEKGTHLEAQIPHMTYLQVTAFRIEPSESTGIMTVDGEVLPCSPIQGQIHRGLGRIISMPQVS
ncbi:sphingosine kinase 1 [Rhinophrynus dorsalis]